jgi:hypothetical protein
MNRQTHAIRPLAPLLVLGLFFMFLSFIGCPGPVVRSDACMEQIDACVADCPDTTSNELDPSDQDTLGTDYRSACEQSCWGLCQ